MEKEQVEDWIDLLKILFLILGFITFYGSLFFIILHFILKYW